MSASTELTALARRMRAGGAEVFARECERIAVDVRRMERTVDEIVEDAREQMVAALTVEGARRAAVADGVVVIGRFGR